MKYVRRLLLVSFCAMVLTFTACRNNDVNDGNNTVNDATNGNDGPVTDGNTATDNNAVDGVGEGLEVQLPALSQQGRFY